MPGALWFVLLMIAAGVSGVAILIVAVRSAIKRRTNWWLLIGVVAFFVVSSALLIDESSKPWTDDGPFHGVPAKRPQRAPDQVFRRSASDVLEVFDARERERAPIVCLRTADGKYKWCVAATGYEDTYVRSVRFEEFRDRLLGPPVVHGRVQWTYGNEGTNWYVSRSGKLEEYWYSW